MEAQSSQSPVFGKSGLYAYLERMRPCIEDGLRAHVPTTSVPFAAGLNEAIKYALFPGGKRLRPVLTFLGAELFGGNPASVLPAAVAVEYIHTSSLIFDDLPFMDNARKRRGRPCLHLQFGEALAALGLLNAAYGLIFECAGKNDSLLIRAHHELVQCIGPQGMIAGQVIDMSVTRKPDAFFPSRDIKLSEEYEAIRNLKTSAMMKMALQLGAILSGADEDQLLTQSHFAMLLGDAFQIRDDLLDSKEDSKEDELQLGRIALKPDAEQARQHALKLITEAKNVLIAGCGKPEPTQLLCEMADYVMWRQR